MSCHTLPSSRMLKQVCSRLFETCQQAAVRMRTYCFWVVLVGEFVNIYNLTRVRPTTTGRMSARSCQQARCKLFSQTCWKQTCRELLQQLDADLFITCSMPVTSTNCNKTGIFLAVWSSLKRISNFTVLLDVSVFWVPFRYLNIKFLIDDIPCQMA